MNSPKRIFKIVVILIISMINFSAFSQEADENSIERIKGDVYRFRHHFTYSVFYVAKSSILLVDPINKETAIWLKKELKKRFNKPIQYVIYSHDHWDHISGGEIFDEGAIYISQEYAKQKIIEKGHTKVPDITFKKQLILDLDDEKSVELFFPGKSHSDNLIIIKLN